ncbi:MAG: nickel-type superoxide dismutase maturation protease [Candidatus Eisenbacteria bacterium]|nr:nickel-type superoxide dismutase maturation protease [Candidatus Eisenbacteria bacterium]
MQELRNLVFWALGRRCRFRISGCSMRPTLGPDDSVWVDLRAYRRRRPAVGETILVRHPFQSDVRMVKRVADVAEDGSCFVKGDNPQESTDSSSFGWIPSRLVLGRVLPPAA